MVCCSRWTQKSTLATSLHLFPNNNNIPILLPKPHFPTFSTAASSTSNPINRLAAELLEPISGLNNVCKWVEDLGLKLQDFFEVIVLAEECARPKPFPDPYLKALDALKVSPNHTFVFEDSVSGIKAANGAGMAAVGMATRNPEQMLIDAGASLVIKDYNDPKLWEDLQEMVHQKLPN